MVPAGQRPDDEAGTTSAASPPPDVPPRADALRRIAAEVSGRHDLDGLFRDVIDEAFALFGVDQAGLWTFDDERSPPLRLVAERGLSADIISIIETLPRNAPTAEREALTRQIVRVIDGDLESTVPEVRAIYRQAGVRTV